MLHAFRLFLSNRIKQMDYFSRRGLGGTIRGPTKYPREGRRLLRPLVDLLGKNSIEQIILSFRISQYSIAVYRILLDYDIVF
jgi:hypothetical protein